MLLADKVTFLLYIFITITEKQKSHDKVNYANILDRVEEIAIWNHREDKHGILSTYIGNVLYEHYFIYLFI